MFAAAAAAALWCHAPRSDRGDLAPPLAMFAAAAAAAAAALWCHVPRIDRGDLDPPLAMLAAAAAVALLPAVFPLAAAPPPLALQAAAVDPAASPQLLHKKWVLLMSFGVVVDPGPA